MRVLKTLLVAVAAIVSACLLFVGAMQALKSGFLRFLEDKSPEYYSEFARACDILLKQNTNELVQISGPSDLLPKIISGHQQR